MSNKNTEKQNDNDTEVSRSFLSMIDAVEQIRRWTSVKTGDIRVMNAEMQLIRLIGRQEGISVGAAAKELGITKGAVSQTLSRLERKGIVIKEIDTDNASRLQLHLSQKGLQIHEAHERYHSELDALEQRILAEGSEESRKFLEHYLSVISEKMNQEHEILSRYLQDSGG